MGAKLIIRVSSFKESSLGYKEAEIPMKNINTSSYVDYNEPYENVTYISSIGIYDDSMNLIAVAKMANPVRKREIDADDAWEAFGAWSELLTTLPVIFIFRGILFISLFMLWSIFFEEVLITIIVILIIIFALYKILDKNKK